MMIITSLKIIPLLYLGTLNPKSIKGSQPSTSTATCDWPRPVRTSPGVQESKHVGLGFRGLGFIYGVYRVYRYYKVYRV